MSDTNKAPSQFSQVVKLLSEISGYVAGIVAFFLAITGRMQTSFPKTVAVLTLLVTVVVLWTWRWPQVSRQKPVGKRKTENKTKKKQTISVWDRILDPLRSASTNAYFMSPIRRRTETGILCVLTVIALGRTGTEFSKVVEELDPSPYALQSPCNVAEEPDALRVVIANFVETSSYETFFEQRLHDEMEEEVQGEAEICLMKEVVENIDQAQAAQDGTHAAVLIWGRSDADVVDVYLEVRGWEILRKKIWSFRREANDFQLIEASHLTFLTQYSVSLLRYIDGQIPKAREELELALHAAQEQPWAGKYAKDIAEAYWLLAQIYQDDTSLPDQEPLERARKSLESALEFEPDFDRALHSQGFVCMELDDRDCAMQAFTTLIDQKSDYAVSAYINRAYLQPKELAEQDFAAAIRLDPQQGYPARGAQRLDWGDLQGAIADLQKAVQLIPDDPYNYHRLGKAQLLSGNFEEAKKIYQEVLPYLDEGTRSYFIEDLNRLSSPANGDEQLRETIDEIIHVLQEARLP